MTSKLPVVDMGQFGLDFCFDEASAEEKDRVTRELSDALLNTGFVYLKNHGFPQHEIDDCFSIAKKYFNQSKEEKEINTRKPGEYEGYLGPGTETFESHNKIEWRESYNFTFINDMCPKNMPEFEVAFRKFFAKVEEMVPRLLRFMALATGLDEEALLPYHKDMIKNPMNVLRVLHYPPLPDDVDKFDRLGMHSDYVTLTLLFQDEVGGLEIRSRNGEWVEAEPIPGTLIFLTGDLTEVWTGGKIKAAKHQVPLPKSEAKRKVSRYSMAAFMGPDMECWVEPMTGDKEKYEGKTAKDHVLAQLLKYYAYN